jgi:type I restriction enzyme S subunit
MSEEIPFFKVSDMNMEGNSVFLRKAANTISRADIPKLGAKLKPARSVIFPKVGGALLTNKKRLLPYPAVIDNNMMAVWPLPDSDLLPAFLYFWFLSIDLAELANMGPLPSINASSLYEQRIALPPRPEQKKIAAVLWKIQRAIEVEEKMAATARELKQSAMRQLFTHGLRNEPQQETDSGLMPKSWAIQPIRSNAKLIAGGTPARATKEFWTDGTIPWVKTGEVDYCVIADTEEKITPLGLENSAARILPKGTLLIAMYGQGITRGKVAILGIDAATNQACAGIVPTNDRLKPLFLYYYLTFTYDRLRSFSHGAQQQNLNAELVASFQVPLTEPDEQNEIASMLQTIDRKISVHDRKRATLSDLFQTLLQNLMTAQIGVDKLNIDTSDLTKDLTTTIEQ